MVEEAELGGLDPFAIMDVEAARLDRHFSDLDEAGWARPSRCAGWTTRDVLAHLAGNEEYHHACLEDDVAGLLERLAAEGVTDVHTANERGVKLRADRPPAEVLDEWRSRSAVSRRRLRERDGGEMATLAGPYPVRRQAFHLAGELATHADDVAVPVGPDDEPGRTEWRARFSRFALAEIEAEVEIVRDGGANRVRLGDDEAVIPDADLVEAANARLPEDHPLPASLRDALTTMP